MMYPLSIAACEQVSAGAHSALFNYSLAASAAFAAGAATFATVSLLSPTDTLSVKNASVHGTGEVAGTIAAALLSAVVLSAFAPCGACHA